MPTLAEVFTAFPGIPLNIELKQTDPPAEAALVAVLDRFAARDQTLLAAEDGTIMARMRAAAPDVLTSFSAPEVAEWVFRLRTGSASRCTCGRSTRRRRSRRSSTSVWTGS